MAQNDSLGRLRVKVCGPFWSAQADLVRLADPRDQRSFRSVFLDASPRSIGGGEELFAPGTLLVLCAVRTVSIGPAGDAGPQYTWRRAGSGGPALPDGPVTQAVLEAALRRGDLALLLAGTDPGAWNAPRDDDDDGRDLPELTCLAGEIGLDGLTPLNDAPARLRRALRLEAAALGERSGAARLPGSVTVHASGATVYGRTTLPWRAEPISAPFQLARLIPDPTSGAPPAARPGYRLTIERERLTPAEQEVLLSAWREFARAVNPSDPLHADPADPLEAPTWVTLEVADPRRLPGLHWPVAAWEELPAARPLHFERGEIAVVLSDQQLHDRAAPPQFLARAIPDSVAVTRTDGELRVDVETGTAPTAGAAQMVYRATRGQGAAWEEGWELADVLVAFDAVEVPRLVREDQLLAVPEWSGVAPLDEPVLWAFLPLADGWAQLPLPNLTERIYLDADLPGPAPPAAPPLLQGAASFGNDPGAPPDEHGWNATITGVAGLRATWRLADAPGSAAAPLALAEVVLRLAAPQLTLNGLLWLSTAAPTARDALPEPDWIASLRAVTLRTPEAAPYPPLVTCPLGRLAFMLRRPAGSAPGKRLPASAQLGAWDLRYAVDADTLQRLTSAHALPNDTFARLPGLVWRRHSRLPMIQALPLTQSRVPPNHPSASRQLAPFELPVTNEPSPARPDDWHFGATGASDWPTLIAAAQPARAWGRRADLPLVALSLPGLVLDPAAGSTDSGLGVDPSTGLPLQYRLDLPYTDEPNALAELPSVPAGTERPPDAAPVELALALTRARFDEHWARLSERASLAAVDAVAAIAAVGAETRVTGLLEPSTWPVVADLALAAYPGRLTLRNAAGDPAPLLLEGPTALRGIDGRFLIDDAAGTLRRLADGDAAAAELWVDAGAAAVRRRADGRYEDQRGLRRGPTEVRGGRMVRTPAGLREDATEYVLMSALEPCTLDVSATGASAGAWQLWFRDLPARDDGFQRDAVHSRQAEDVNDPEALARERNFLLGYEWRLAPEHLVLFGLEFNPLTLEDVRFADDRAVRVELVGRLQLPLAAARAPAELANAVRLTFAAPDGSGELVLTALENVSEVVEWPLALTGDGETGAGPLLRARQLALAPDGRAAVVADAELAFVLFDAPWTVPLGPLALDAAGSALEVAVATEVSDGQPPPPLAPAELRLRIDRAAGNHAASLLVDVRLGPGIASGSPAPALQWRPGPAPPVSDPDAAGPALSARVRFEVDGTTGNAVSCESATLLGALRLPCGAGDQDRVLVAHNPGALQLSWHRHAGPVFDPAAGSGPQLLPGMGISSQEVPGTAAVTITVVAPAPFGGMPQLTLATAYLESVLTCRWGEPLRAGHVPPDRRRAAVFKSSAGDILVGYTGTFADTAWDQSLLLNGTLELTNLVSWPLAAAYDDADTALRLPAARPTSSPFYDAIGRLSGLRALWRWGEPSGTTVADEVGQADLEIMGTATRGVPSLIAPSDENPATRLSDNASASAGNVHALAGRAPFTWGVLFAPATIDITPRNILAKREGSGTAAHGYHWTHRRAGVRFTRTVGDRTDEVTDATPLTKNRPELLVVTYDGERLRMYRGGTERDSGASRASLRDTSATLRWGARSDGALSAPGVYQAAFLINRALTATEVAELQAARAIPSGSTPQTVPPLDHERHAIRILFNQHEIPPGVLVQGSEDVLFDLAEGRSWQFAAVVEHQLVDVHLDAGVDAPVVHHDRRWTGIQEIRVHHPGDVKRFLAGVGCRSVPDPASETGRGPSGNTLDGYLGAGLRHLLSEGADAELDRLPPRALLIEASAVHWVDRVPTAAVNPTVLQFLPFGSQVATLTDPDDLRTTDPQEPGWVLLATPFLGRLQTGRDDGLEANDVAAGALRVDPILLLHRSRERTPPQPLPAGALALATWGDTVPLRIDVTVLDTAAGRSVARLDPVSLEENWFRLQLPASDMPTDRILSVLAGFPQTPARLSRPVALQRAFDASLRAYPSSPDQPNNAPAPSGAVPVWRQGSLLAPQAITAAQDDRRGWAIRALQFLTAGLASVQLDASDGIRHFVAATVLPFAPDPEGRPMVLAVSPYLDVALRPAAPLRRLRLVIAELLCLDPGARTLRPVAAQTYELVQPQDTGEAIRASSQAWARETHARLAPESPVALLRYRELEEPLPDQETRKPQAPVSTRYDFALVDGLASPAIVPRRTFALRAAPENLRAREGQFGGSAMPVAPHPLEIAPPQAIGVQALHLAKRPGAGTWPWGLTAFRVVVCYTAAGEGVIGHLDGPGGDVTRVLWWQLVQHTLQYRSGSSGAPASGLPPRFRGPAITSLLPVLPAPRMPAEDPAELLGTSASPLLRWQPVLPGTVRYLLLGGRPGAPYAMRHALARQALTGDVLVSGSLPVQHRFPRPVALPPNREEARAIALQPWASHFEPGRDALVTAAPADEAFFARSGDEPACALRMQLVTPSLGVLTTEWDGELGWAVDALDEATPPAHWEIRVGLVDRELVVPFEAVIADEADPLRRFRPRAGTNVRALVQRLAGRSPGSTVVVTARVRPLGREVATAGGTYQQVLSFPLRVGAGTAPALPLEPRFVHFEDPEYNARLASAPARAARSFPLRQREVTVLHTATLATDRRQYNPDSLVALRWDWNVAPPGILGAIRLRSIDAADMAVRLEPKDDTARALLNTLPSAALAQIDLAALRAHDSGTDVRVQPGQTLQVELSLLLDPGGAELGSIFLNVDVVEDAVTPVPEAGYALLRRTQHDDHLVVECVRFAWGPEALRVELVCAADLRTEVVRRRAVFRWTDVQRRGHDARHAVQKVAQTGSTAVPTF